MKTATVSIDENEKIKYDTQYTLLGNDGHKYLIDGFSDDSEDELMSRAGCFYGVPMRVIVEKCRI
jgi:hypothetical protein